MSNQHLTHEERSTIAILKSKNHSNIEIAAITDRHRTTIWRVRIPGQRMIDERPPEIEHRERIGDYEMDTVIGKPSDEVPVTMVTAIKLGRAKNCGI